MNIQFRKICCKVIHIVSLIPLLIFVIQTYDKRIQNSIFMLMILCEAVLAEWLRRLTRNQIPFGSVGSNPTGCDNFFSVRPQNNTIVLNNF